MRCIVCCCTAVVTRRVVTPALTSAGAVWTEVNAGRGATGLAAGNGDAAGDTIAPEASLTLRATPTLSSGASAVDDSDDTRRWCSCGSLALPARTLLLRRLLRPTPVPASASDSGRSTEPAATPLVCGLPRRDGDSDGDGDGDGDGDVDAEPPPASSGDAVRVVRVSSGDSCSAVTDAVEKSPVLICDSTSSPLAISARTFRWLEFSSPAHTASSTSARPRLDAANNSINATHDTSHCHAFTHPSPHDCTTHTIPPRAGLVARVLVSSRASDDARDSTLLPRLTL
jgi:hypothetical protein